MVNYGRSMEDIHQAHETHTANNRKSTGRKSCIRPERPKEHAVGCIPESVYTSWRTGSDWFKIIGYYVIYYAFLVAILLLVVNWDQSLWAQSLPSAKPYSQARIHSPGMSIFPIMWSRPDYHDPTSEYGHVIDLNNDIMTTAYKSRMEKFIQAYIDEAQSDNSVDCDGSKTYRSDNTMKNCKIYNDYQWITDKCGNDFGYNSNKTGNASPCLIVSLNNIINWQLVGLSGSITKSKNQGEIIGDGNHVHFHCDIWDKSEKAGYSTETISTKYEIEWIEPSNGQYANGKTSIGGQIPNYFYPYRGHDKNTIYNTPCNSGYDEGRYQECNIRANKPFKVMKLIKKDQNSNSNIDINLKCSAYANNIQNSYYDETTKMYKWKNSQGQEIDQSLVAYNGMAVLAEFVLRDTLEIPDE
jgi:hypothetical protein